MNSIGANAEPIAASADARRGFLLYRNGYAAGAYRGLLRGFGIWDREWRPDAVAYARSGHYQSAFLWLDRGPDRAVSCAPAQLVAASGIPSALLLGERVDLALHCNGAVRLGSGRYRPDIHADRSGILSRGGSGNARRARALSDPGRHGNRRMDVR